MSFKKIVVLVDWFAPGYKAGGPIQSCVNFAFSLKESFEIYVLTTDTDHGETTPYAGIPTGEWISPQHPGFKVKYLPKATLSREMLKKELIALDADYLYLNHMFSPLFVIYPLWLKYKSLVSGQVVLCPRGALYDSALSVKPWKKKPFMLLFGWLGIERKIVFHATNEREKEAILRFYPRSEVRIADNLPKSDQPDYRTVAKTPGSLKVIFIARIHPIKNLLFLLTALDNVKASVTLTIIGPVEDQAFWEECRRKIGQLPANVQASWLGPKRNDELLPILREHHLFSLPTTGENFGHSIFEAFLAGRPVLISDQTPWLDLAKQRVGWDLPLGDPAVFTRALEEAAAWDQQQFDGWGQSAWQYARKFIQNPELHGQYLKLFV